MGKCFQYNYVYYIIIDEKLVIVEEFVLGFFVKLINNNGKKVDLFEDVDKDLKDLLVKVECLVYYIYELFN